MSGPSASRSRQDLRDLIAPSCAPFLFRDDAGHESQRLADLRPDRPAFDVADLADRLLLAPPRRADQTPYRGIRAVMSGDAVTSASDAATERRAAPDAVVALREALETTVRDALVGSSRVAVLTGGGVDSSALLALAHRHMVAAGGSAFGVALDFAGPGDDRPHREALARHLGCEILCVAPEEAAARFAAVGDGVDAVPLTWPGAAMEIEAIARARAHGADLVLTGVGADELFDGEPRALAEQARQGDPLGAVRSARAMRGFDASSPAFQWVARPLLASLVPKRLRLARALRSSTWAPVWAGPALEAAAAAQRDRRVTDAFRPQHTPRQRLEALVNAPHRTHLAWLRHQEQVGGGLERRDPYLSPALARVVTSFAPSLLLHGDIRRGLFREACRDLLPATLRARVDKASFEPAFARCFVASDAARRLQPVATLAALADLRLVVPGPFRSAFERFVADPSEGWEDVWPTLAVESFLRGAAGSAS